MRIGYCGPRVCKSRRDFSLVMHPTCTMAKALLDLKIGTPSGPNGVLVKYALLAFHGQRWLFHNHLLGGGYEKYLLPIEKSDRSDCDSHGTKIYIMLS